MVQQILRVTKDTFLKLRPEQSTQLAPEELSNVAAGTTFEIQSYAYADINGSFDGHIKFTLLNSAIRGLNTWFVYGLHAQVEFDGQVVYPHEDQVALPILRIAIDTVLKRRPIQSSDLAPEERFPVRKGQSFNLQSYAYADAQGDFSDHIKFAIRSQQDFIQGISTWFAYSRHAYVEFDNKIVYPPQLPGTGPGAPPFKGTPLTLPGNISTFYTDQPIIPGGSFTWGEATKDASRIPDTPDIVRNILALARELQKARDLIGRPFIVNSWYRPPSINQSVGGVGNSQHLFGKAVDIEVPGYSGRRVANVLLSSWPGGIGIYSNLPNIVHLDIGSKRYWGF